MLTASHIRGDIPIPVDVPTACFVPSRNQDNAQNHVEYMPTFTIPENVTRLGLYWYPRSTMNATYSRLFRQVVAVAAGQQYRVDYGSEIDGTGGSAFIRYSQRINGVTPSVLDY